jgi:hypothetical protein
MMESVGIDQSSSAVQAGLYTEKLLCKGKKNTESLKLDILEKYSQQYCLSKKPALNPQQRFTSIIVVQTAIEATMGGGRNSAWPSCKCTGLVSLRTDSQIWCRHNIIYYFNCF